MNNKFNKGFTLVEMLVVVAVIAILAGVAFTGLTGVQANARDTARIGNMESVKVYLEAYNVKCGHYPGIVDAGNANCSSAVAQNNWTQLTAVMNTAGITTKLPQDPIPARTYYYGVDTTAGQEGLRYVIGAWFEKDNNKLRNDIDGTSYGVDCTDTPKMIYCITSD